MGLDLWDMLVRHEAEHATFEHEGGEIPHDGLSLEVEVAKHFVGAPVDQIETGMQRLIVSWPMCTDKSCLPTN